MLRAHLFIKINSIHYPQNLKTPLQEAKVKSMENKEAELQNELKLMNDALKEKDAILKSKLGFQTSDLASLPCKAC